MKKYFDALNILFNNYSNSNFFLKKKDILLNSIGNISSETVFANYHIPSFCNSAMDGYAIQSKKTYLNNKFKKKIFFIIDRITAGEYAEFDNLDGDFVVEIMTGARLPSGFDSVIKLEDVYINKKKEIIINRIVNFGENVRSIGEDFVFKDIILNKGEIISSSHILVLSSFGKNDVNVLPKPKIYLLCTGNELINYKNRELYKSPSIFNSTSSYIKNFFNILNIDITFLGIVKDSTKDFLKKINFILNTKVTSIIITTGAISKGCSDFIPQSLNHIGVKILFHGVKMKPGKPILFGKYNKYIYFFCLPGNPISSIIGVRFFVYPFVRHILGLTYENPIKAYLINTYKKKRYCDLFLKAYSYFENSSFYVEILDAQESFKVNSMLRTNSFIFLKKHDNVKIGSKVDIFFYKPSLN